MTMCDRQVIPGTVIGEQCFGCGHTNLVHPGPHNPAITVCVLCEMEPLRHLEALSLRPGDILVYRDRGYLDEEEVKTLMGHFDAALPGHKVIILENGADLGVIRAEVQP